MAPDLAFALELADLADSLSLPRFRADDLEVERKPDRSPVTDADRTVERALRERIAAERPGEAVFGEEEGGPGAAAAEGGPALRPGGGGFAAAASSLRWILDPIDGTRNFSRGIPVWATLVALERDGEPALGVVSAPALGHRWWAARGEGAFRDGERITVSRTDALADAAVSCAYARDLVRVAPAVWHARGFGDWWQSMLVAEGSLDAAVDANLALWDYAALVPIVEEAGGRVTALDGGAVAPKRQLVCSNGLLHDQVLALLSDPSPRK